MNDWLHAEDRDTISAFLQEAPHGAHLFQPVLALTCGSLNVNVTARKARQSEAAWSIEFVTIRCGTYTRATLDSTTIAACLATAN